MGCTTSTNSARTVGSLDPDTAPQDPAQLGNGVPNGNAVNSGAISASGLKNAQKQSSNLTNGDSIRRTESMESINSKTTSSTSSLSSSNNSISTTLETTGALASSTTKKRNSSFTRDVPLVTAAATAAVEAVSGKIKEVKTNVVEPIQSTINLGINSGTEKVNSVLDDINAGSEKVHSMINDNMDKLKTGLGLDIDNVENKAKELSKNIANNSQMAEEEVDIDLTDPEVGKAAVKIQAGFKSFMARKKPDAKGSDSDPDGGAKDGNKADNDDNDAKELEDGVADIDLEDPEVEKAATKIQATFRGYKTRKDNNGLDNNNNNGDGGDSGGQSDKS